MADSETHTQLQVLLVQDLFYGSVANGSTYYQVDGECGPVSDAASLDPYNRIEILATS